MFIIVGGIGVKDHFEVNLCPLNVALTHRLYKLFMAYFFPGRAHEYVREAVEEYDGFTDGGGSKVLYKEGPVRGGGALKFPESLYFRTLPHNAGFVGLKFLFAFYRQQRPSSNNHMVIRKI